jgi:hypothetical protein
MDVKWGMRLPVKYAADGIAPVHTVPKIADVFGIPNEQALKRRDQEFSRCQLADKLRDVLIPDIDFSITIIQNPFSAAQPKLYRRFSISQQAEIEIGEAWNGTGSAETSGSSIRFRDSFRVEQEICSVKTT